MALDGSLYLIGGDGSNAIWRISPTGGVTLAGRLAAPLSDAAATVVGSSIYIFGGNGSDRVLRATLPRR